ncbi:hypothetical protein AL755_13535 [Arthrobacter sp. ERGS1:01]|nr:hypothetical protein AL755_13535 [Arthrobacter sp. ERGS1:01]
MLLVTPTQREEKIANVSQDAPWYGPDRLPIWRALEFPERSLALQADATWDGECSGCGAIFGLLR